MKLIVGLGNPGEKYLKNRHNVGMMFVDYIVNVLTGSRVNELKQKKMLHVTCFVFRDLILAKPLTFMNNSGVAVKKLFTEYRLPITDLLIVHDDLDIPIGKFKIQKTTGPKLHNGIESVENYLGTRDFWRVRIGIDNRKPESWIDGETYTLQDFREEERKIIEEIFPKIIDQLSLRFNFKFQSSNVKSSSKLKI